MIVMADQDIRYVLGIDTALNGCGVALYDAHAKGMIFDVFEPVARGQSERLIPMLEEQLKAAGLAYNDIGLLVGITGPGSFAGIRVGLSVVRSLSLALSIPAVGVTSTDALAYQFVRDHDLFDDVLYIVLESKRDDFYIQKYARNDKSKAVESVFFGCIDKDDLCAMIDNDGCGVQLYGDGVGRFLNKENQEFDGIDLGHVCEMSVNAFMSNDMLVIGDVVPAYFRGADVSQSKKKFRPVEQK